MNRPLTFLPSNGDTHQARFKRTLVLTSFGTFVVPVAYAGPLGNAATLAAALNASTPGLTWVLNSMSVALAVSLLVAGRLADVHGQRRIFAMGAWVFAAGSAVCAVATDTPVFVAGRLVEGLGAAGVVVTGLGLVSAASRHAEHRAAAASWWGVSVGAGIALGPVLTGLLDLADQWRVFYVVLLCLGVVIARASRRLVADAPDDAARPPAAAAVALMTTGLSSVLIALVEVRLHDALLAGVWGLIALTGLTAFALSQAHGRAPLLDPRVFRRPDFAAATAAALATGVGVVALMSFASTFFVTGLGMSTLGAGALLALWSGTSAVAAVAARRLPPGLIGPSQLTLGLFGVGLGLMLLTRVTPGASPWRLAPGLVLAGIFSGILNAGLARQSVETAPRAQAALGIGTNNTARYVGSSLGVTIVTLIASQPRADVATRVAGWDEAAFLTAVLTLAGAALVAVLHRRGRAAVAVPPAERTR